MWFIAGTLAFHQASLSDFDLNSILVIFKTIFSWVILMPIAVVISGTLLAKCFSLQVETQQRFVIPIPKILHLEATNGEVTLGFAGFIITLLIIGLLGGPTVYSIFRNQFGIDPGQFNSLCIISSFVTVIWSVILWLLYKSKTALPDEAALERDRQIIELSRRLKNEDE
jgi:uncharacterized membrane-anchored protein